MLLITYRVKPKKIDSVTVQNPGTETSSLSLQNCPTPQIFDWDYPRKLFSAVKQSLQALLFNFNMQRQCTRCTDRRQAARKYEGTSDKSIPCILFPPHRFNTLSRKLGTKRWPGRKLYEVTRLNKRNMYNKSTGRHPSSCITRKNKLLAACFPLHIFLCVTRSRWDKAPSVLAASNAGVRASPSLKER